MFIFYLLTSHFIQKWRFCYGQPLHNYNESYISSHNKRVHADSRLMQIKKGHSLSYEKQLT